MWVKSIYWYFFNKEKYHNYKILKWLIKAKQYYIKKNCDGMCVALSHTHHPQLSHCEIERFLPEYYPAFFETESNTEGYWWKKGDTSSRICAFNKLIRIYKRKCN